MKARVTLLAAALAWSACSATGPLPPVPLQTFTLRPGESAWSADGAVRVGFDGVLTDSRCPKGERCVWAGDATVRVWLQQGAGARQALELHTAPGPAQAARHQGVEVRLVSLDPYPIAGRPVAKAAALATLTLGAGSAPAPDR